VRRQLLSHLRDGEQKRVNATLVAILLSHLRDGELEQKTKLPQKIKYLTPNQRLNLQISSDNLTV
jgi:hypothetical protein